LGGVAGKATVPGKVWHQALGVAVQSPEAVGVLNVAITFLVELIVSVQLPMPEQSPLQPAKVLLPIGAAISVTTCPKVKVRVQVEPQLMKVSALATVPVPAPARLTERTGDVTVPLNTASEL